MEDAVAARVGLREGELLLDFPARSSMLGVDLPLRTRSGTVERLTDANVHTVEQLSAMDPPVRVGIGPVALERLRHQARLQTDFRRTGTHRYELLAIDERTGFRLLPPPSPGDIFFDIEGDPYFEPEAGLEYLFGATTIDSGTPTFQPFLALDRREEKIALERFVDFVRERRERWPDLHVYHYASYEPAALKRLMGLHGTREDAIDDLLRGEVFVDLYQVVRQALRISHAGYSIKKVRTFFMAGAGQGRVTGGGDSILEFERWRATGDDSILRDIVAYNEEDCLSTLELRDWLLERKSEAERTSGVTISWTPAAVKPESARRAEDDAATAMRRAQLQALGREDTALLADLLTYHRREDKPEWWAYYDRQKKSLDDLLDDGEAIAYLEAVPGEEPQAVDRSSVHPLRFPDQEFKLGADPQRSVEDPFRKQAAGSIAWIDGAAGCLGLKRGNKRAGDPLPRALVPAKPIGTSPQRQAIGRVAHAVGAGRGRRAGVSVTPARMELAVTPSGASSKASWRMWASRAALAAETAP